MSLIHFNFNMISPVHEFWRWKLKRKRCQIKKNTPSRQTTGSVILKNLSRTINSEEKRAPGQCESPCGSAVSLYCHQNSCCIWCYQDRSSAALIWRQSLCLVAKPLPQIGQMVRAALPWNEIMWYSMVVAIERTTPCHIPGSWIACFDSHECSVHFRLQGCRPQMLFGGWPSDLVIIIIDIFCSIVFHCFYFWSSNFLHFPSHIFIYNNISFIVN